ncbi:cytochrome c-type biogenesis protein CcmF [Allosediminivita pacifica]|uniref:Cytochrome c-type biogenesis protein CcmF n=2 Tax=Allosediminivita pacifica TaxID=1267769 RepID=A0A2T6B2G7_9RHOB|nr:cytochrome c-type biogenesis protein CcmF [Allosediminivita pacifica]
MISLDPKDVPARDKQSSRGRRDKVNAAPFALIGAGPPLEYDRGMVTEFGHFALILAFLVAIVQMVVPMAGAHKRWPGWMAVAEPAATTQFLLIGFSFLALTWAFLTSDFSLRLVYLNSHSAKPLIYKISGVWGNHEGSMLLWVLILSLFGAMAAWFGGNLPPGLRARVLSVQAAIGVAFIAFILFTSNPFERMPVPPFDGQDLNPLLQDPGLAFHPPFLYLGYVGLSICFSFAVAALIEGRVDAAWARWVRPWTLAAWVCLTIGIALGSWWAYYELGWGGFWFWDPVENASFMPWLLAAALLHSAIVVEKRESLKSWTILLAILAFGFSLIGTFIVRSGVITSVHSFASDPERGVFILLILVVFTGGALTLFAARSGVMQARGVFGIVSRESALVANNILLAVSAFVVFVGTLWPLVAEMAFDRKLSVGPPFFDMAFTPFMLILGLLLPFGSMLAWKRGSASRVARQLAPAFFLALALLGLTWVLQTGRSLLGPMGVFLGAWLIGGAVTDLISRTGQNRDWSRLRRLPRADWGKSIAHAGLGITMLGIAGLTAWEQEDIRIAQIGEPFEVAGFELELLGVEEIQGPNYYATQGEVAIRSDGDEIARLFPQKRNYPVAQMPTTEAAIDYRFLRDLYVVIGDEQSGGGWVIRTYLKPLANWIWGGAILMALGGFVSLSDRRFRVAAGAGKRTAAKGVPAE